MMCLKSVVSVQTLGSLGHAAIIMQMKGEILKHLTHEAVGLRNMHERVAFAYTVCV